MKVAAHLAIRFYTQTEVRVAMDSNACGDFEKLAEIGMFTMLCLRILSNLGGSTVAVNLAEMLCASHELLPAMLVGEFSKGFELVEGDANDRASNGFDCALEFSEGIPLFDLKTDGFGLLGRGLGYYSPMAAAAVMYKFAISRRHDVDYLKRLSAAAIYCGRAKQRKEVDLRNQPLIGAQIIVATCADLFQSRREQVGDRIVSATLLQDGDYNEANKRGEAVLGRTARAAGSPEAASSTSFEGDMSAESLGQTNAASAAGQTVDASPGANIEGNAQVESRFAAALEANAKEVRSLATIVQYQSVALTCVVLVLLAYAGHFLLNLTHNASTSRSGVIDYPQSTTDGKQLESRQYEVADSGSNPVYPNLENGQSRELRTWTDTKGRKIVAYFVGISNGYAQLEKENGKILRVKLSSLCTEDRESLNSDATSATP